MKLLYGTYRSKRITNPFNLGEVSLNGVYTPSFFINNMYSDWQEAGLTKLVDNLIQEEQYTGEVVPGVKKLTRFLVFEYNETYVDPIELTRSAENVGKEFDIDILTSEEALAWIKENTNLEEVEPGKFILSPAGVDMEGKPTEPTYLIIE